jgi:hypothetical protein
MQKSDHNIGFREKRQFFRRKLQKNHNIDPRHAMENHRLHTAKNDTPMYVAKSWLEILTTLKK